MLATLVHLLVHVQREEIITQRPVILAHMIVTIAYGGKRTGHARMRCISIHSLVHFEHLHAIVELGLVVHELVVTRGHVLAQLTQIRMVLDEQVLHVVLSRGVERLLEMLQRVLELAQLLVAKAQIGLSERDGRVSRFSHEFLIDFQR